MLSQTTNTQDKRISTDDPMVIERIALATIVRRVESRTIKPSGVERLKQSIQQYGYRREKPVLVTPIEAGYLLIDGGHRVEALLALGETHVSAVVDPSLAEDEDEQLKTALSANAGTEALVKTLFTDYAELIWRLNETRTLERVATVVGWSLAKVKQYSALRSLDAEVWAIVKTTTENAVTEDEENAVTGKVTSVTFTENLLRLILDLTPDQQRDLVERLIAGKNFGKVHFKKLAGAYKIRNEMKVWAREVLTGLPDEYHQRADEEIDRGSYDDDWATSDRPQLQKLISALRDEYAQKTALRCLHGNFLDVTTDLPAGSIDLILTDPPYNISGNGGVQKRGNSHATLDVDRDEDWDSQDRERFIRELLTPWMQEWARLLRPGGSLIVFLDALLIETLWFLGAAHGLAGKRLFYWIKTNQNPAALTRRNAIPCVEQMVWLVKPGAPYTFNEVPGWDRRNYLEVPLCGGKERLVDAHGATLHPAQKPEAVIEPLLLLTSNRGDVVLDSHAGTGTTGAVARRHGRKFIGIEQHTEYVAAMRRRLHDDERIS